MIYLDPPVLDEQRESLQPAQISSGMIAGSTQLRIGGDSNITIDGINRRIIISDGTDNRVVIGILTGTEYGMAVSKEGEDIIEALEA